MTDTIYREAQKVMPLTDCGEIKFINDAAYDKRVITPESEHARKLQRIVHNEKSAIRRVISLFYIQSHYSDNESYIDKFQDMSEVLLHDCIEKGYLFVAMELLKCISSSALDGEKGYPNKQEVLSKGVLDVLACYGKCQIITEGKDYRSRVINVIVKVRQNYLGKLNLTTEQMAAAYDGCMYGGKENLCKLTPLDLKLCEAEA